MSLDLGKPWFEAQFKSSNLGLKFITGISAGLTPKFNLKNTRIGVSITSVGEERAVVYL